MSNTVAPQSPGLLEQGDPAEDVRAFRRALGQFATGITVIATNSENHLVAMAANSFSAVSLDPPLVLWSIRKESKSAPAFLDNGHFSVSVLAEDQVEVSALFGRPLLDQFTEVDWKPSRHGDPLISGAIAHFECSSEAVLDGGDHHILVGRVEHFARYDGGPLLFAQGQYCVSSSHPAMALSTPSATDDSGKHSEESLFMSLLQAADHHMSTLFQGHRQQVGLTVATARLLNRLARGSCDQDTLEQSTFLGDIAVEDALAELRERNQVTRSYDGTWALTDEGYRVRIALRRNAEKFTEQQLSGISPEDLAAAERVLTTLLTRNSNDTSLNQIPDVEP